MKRLSTAALFLVGFIVVWALLAIACADKDKEDWEKADKANTVAAFELYLQERPEGKYAPQARDHLDDLRWQEAETADTASAFEQYLQLQPDGKYVSQAAERLEELDWQEAGTANTIASYQQYLASHASGRDVEEANQKVAALVNDDSPFLAAQQEGTRTAYEDFLAKFPGHRREAEARGVLDGIVKDMEGRNLADLIAENKVEAKPKGSGIDSVEVEVRRLVNHDVTVHVPVGTFFASQGYAQNMVATAEKRLTLANDDWASLVVEAACANLHRPVPGDQDAFSITSASQPGLQEVVNSLAKAGKSGTDVGQAAVWIVTDNASYSDLGILVLSISRARAINEDEAAEAMKIVDEAGIDITQRAIWWDRSQILQGMTNESLKSWLQQRG